MFDDMFVQGIRDRQYFHRIRAIKTKPTDTTAELEGYICVEHTKTTPGMSREVGSLVWCLGRLSMVSYDSGTEAIL